MSTVKATLSEYGVKGDPSLLGITDQRIVDEILNSQDVENLKPKDLKTNDKDDIIIEVPHDLSNLNITSEFKNLLEQYKGKRVCISILKA
jgi:hypothetical protein